MSKKIFVILGVVTSIALVFYVIQRLSKGDIEVSPKKQNNSAGPIVIKASKNISPDKGGYIINPEVPGDIQVIDNYIIFWPQDGQGFQENTSYTATFINYQTTEGKPLKIPTVSFKVNRYTDYSTLQRYTLDKYGRFEESLNPFLEKLPHTEPYRYKVSYEINDIHDNSDDQHHENEAKSSRELLGTDRNWKEKKNNYTVTIETLVFQSELQTIQEYKQEVEAARNEALSWIAKQGVDPQNDIIYEFVPNNDQLNNTSNNDIDVEI